MHRHLHPAIVALALALAALCACGGEFVPPGPPAQATGYLSDRAVETVDPTTGSVGWIPGESGALSARAPDYDALWADGELRVGVMIGSMAKAPEIGRRDEGLRTTEWFVSWLRSHGFERAGWGRYERGGDRPVVVRLYGADRYELYDPVQLHRSYLRDLVAWSDLFYLGGHARQPGLGALAEAATYGERRYRVQLFDVCWSYQLYTVPALELGGGHVVNLGNRSVTGSIESLPVVLQALVAGGSGWLEIIAALNDRAAVRAEERAGQVAEHLQDAEVYGVSGGVW